MTYSKKWVVTYTKHLKQKRKIYHDGTLELSDSGNKVLNLDPDASIFGLRWVCELGQVLLYDDSEKLIDSRFLKKDEVVESGGTLTFEAHLVDVGNLEREKHPSANQSASRGDLKLSGKASAMQQKGDRKSPLLRELPHKVPGQTTCRNRAPGSLENKKSTIGSKPLRNHLGAITTNTIKVVKDELNSSEAAEVHDAIQNSTEEWNILYTTQVTQKSKKYHDGILRILLSGSRMNQIMLLSEDGSILSNKCLKSTGCIKSGNKCEFPGYIVEICERRANCKEDIQKLSSKPLPDSSCSSDIKSASRRVNILKAQMEPATSSCISDTAKMKDCKQGQSDKSLCDENTCKAQTEQIVCSYSSHSTKSIDCTRVQSGKPLSDDGICKARIEQTVDLYNASSAKTTDCTRLPLRDVYHIIRTLKKPLPGDEYDLVKGPVAQANASPSVDATKERKNLNLQEGDNCYGGSNESATHAFLSETAYVTSAYSQKMMLEPKLEIDSLPIANSPEEYNISDPGSFKRNIQGLSANTCCYDVQASREQFGVMNENVPEGEPRMTNGKGDTADTSDNFLEMNIADNGLTSAGNLNGHEISKEEIKEEESGMSEILDASASTNRRSDSFEDQNSNNERFTPDGAPSFDLCF